MIDRHGPAILASIGGLDSYASWASAFDEWNVNERLAKFIVNAVRVYEFWGCSWWMPFFDHDYFGFWERVPPAYRLNQRLHVEYVDRLYRELTHEEPPLARADRWKYSAPPRAHSDPLANLKAALRPLWQSPTLAPVRRLEIARRARRAYRAEPMAWYGMIGLGEFTAAFSSGTANINAFLAERYLREKAGTLPSSGSVRGAAVQTGPGRGGDR